MMTERVAIQTNYACGCVTCVCDDEERCHGCGAKSCGNPAGCYRKRVSVAYEPTPDAREAGRKIANQAHEHRGLFQSHVFHLGEEIARAIARATAASEARVREATIALIESRAMRSNKLGELDGSFAVLTNDVADQLIAAIRALGGAR